MPIDHGRLARLLGGEDLGWLVDRCRRRMERGQSLTAPVTLADATPGQRTAVHRLLGRPPRPGSALTVSLAAVDEVIRRSGACPDGLAAAVVALTGDVTDRAVADAERDRWWRAAFAPLDAAVAAHPDLADWLHGLHATGLVRRLAGTPESATPLLAELATVIGNLPAAGEPIGRFAARTTGRAHALDPDRALATLALGAARSLSGLPDGAGAEWRREVWASVGVLRDELSSTVLTLGLPGDAQTSTGRALAAWHETGQPAVLTLRQLVRDPPLARVREVFVCENPVVVATAADHLGARCLPLVCTSGQPGAAVLHLLRRLASAGAAVRYHGDFDWGGLRIGNVVFARLPTATPWRFQIADYRAAADRGRDLTGTPAVASWDEGLGAAMRETGIAVEEEHVIDDLLPDLAG
jgi:uncharacterized protein (TIGR02679 family)